MIAEGVACAGNPALKMQHWIKSLPHDNIANEWEHMIRDKSNVAAQQQQQQQQQEQADDGPCDTQAARKVSPAGPLSAVLPSAVLVGCMGCSAGSSMSTLLSVEQHTLSKTGQSSRPAAQRAFPLRSMRVQAGAGPCAHVRAEVKVEAGTEAEAAARVQAHLAAAYALWLGRLLW